MNMGIITQAKSEGGRKRKVRNRFQDPTTILMSEK